MRNIDGGRLMCGDKDNSARRCATGNRLIKARAACAVEAIIGFVEQPDICL